MTTKIFHNKETKRVTCLDNRYYTNDDINYFPGATTVLEAYPKGAWYLKWIKEQGDNADKIRDEAGEVGTKIHSATEALDNGIELKLFNEEGKGNYSIEEWQMILNYADFHTKLQPKLLANESVFCSPELGYGGQIDRVLEFGGKRWLCDIKTSNQIADTYILQLASYAILWNTFNPQYKIDDTCIIWLKSKIKTTKIDDTKNIWQGKPDDNTVGWQIVTFEEKYEKTYEDFKHILAIWKRANKNYKPANKQYPDAVSLKKQ